MDGADLCVLNLSNAHGSSGLIETVLSPSSFSKRLIRVSRRAAEFSLPYFVNIYI